MDKFMFMPLSEGRKLRQEADSTQPPASVTQRIESLIERTGISYYELAKVMGITRATVHAVRHGKRQPTRKFTAKLDLAEQRIEAARRGEGILTRRTEALLVTAATTPTPVEDILLPQDTIEVRLTTTEGNTEPEVVQLKLTKPPKAQAIGAINRALTHEQCDELLMLCLDPEHANQQFIERISGPSYYVALKKCVQLILGGTWEQDLHEIVFKLAPRINAIVDRLNPPEPPSAPVAGQSAPPTR